MDSINSFQQFFRVQSPTPPLFNQSRARAITPSKQQSNSQQRDGGSAVQNRDLTKRKSYSFLRKAEATTTRTFARFRPLNEQEWQGNQSQPVQYQDERTVVVAGQPYTLDKVFTPADTQQEIYESVARATVQDVMNGINGTIIAYGQTGSGKTYTMLGSVEDQGIIYRAISEILSRCEVSISLLEVYRESINDLLNGLKDLRLKEDPASGVYVERLSRVVVENEAQMLELIRFAEERRHVSETKFNSSSSRSHLILTVQVTNGGKLNLVDLAGSEKVAKTGAKGETLEEAKKINSSLSCLGHVVQSLSQGLEHIPYRDSKLTRILQDSLQGGCRTSLVPNQRKYQIVTCSPHQGSLDETVSSLKFAQRAKLMKPQIKGLPEKRSYRDLEDEVLFLKEELMQTKVQLNQAIGSYSTLQTQVDNLEEAHHSAKQNNSPYRMSETPPEMESSHSSAQRLNTLLERVNIDVSLELSLNDVQRKLSYFLQAFSQFMKEFTCTTQAKGLSCSLMDLNQSFQTLSRIVKQEEAKFVQHQRCFEEYKKSTASLKGILVAAQQNLALEPDSRGFSFSQENANIRVDQILNQVALTDSTKPTASDYQYKTPVHHITLKTEETESQSTPSSQMPRDKENVDPVRKRSTSRRERGAQQQSASQKYLKTSEQRMQGLLTKLKRM